LNTRLKSDWWHIRDNERPHDLEALEDGSYIVVYFEPFAARLPNLVTVTGAEDRDAFFMQVVELISKTWLTKDDWQAVEQLLSEQ